VRVNVIHFGIRTMQRALGGALLLGLALFQAAGLSAQQVIEGKILRASDGAPIEDVSVRVVGEDLLVGSDSLGVFRFNLPDDRPGFALEIEVIGFTPVQRTWMLPLERPLVIALEQDVVPLEGIDVDVDRPSGWTARPMEEKLEFRATQIMGNHRSADLRKLRDFEHQEAEIWDFLPQMNAVGLYDGGFRSGGYVRAPTYILDDRMVAFDEFRSYAVGEMCRLDLVTIPRLGRGRLNGSSSNYGGVVLGYTCAYLMDVATGRRTLTPFLPESIEGQRQQWGIGRGGGTEPT